jgi:hypothetical protein
LAASLAGLFPGFVVSLPSHGALRAAKRQKHSLLARYSETLGEMMLRRQTEMAIRAAR